MVIGQLHYLKRLGLNQENAQDLVKAWGVMVGYTTPSASISQLIQAYQNDILTEQEFVKALQDKGYPQPTIEFYIKLANGPSIEVTRELTKADILGLFADEIITKENALERLINLGYSPDDSELLLARKKLPIEKTREYALFIQGYLGGADFVDILLSMGYSIEEIGAFLDSIGA